MGKTIDLIKKQFGRLTVVEISNEQGPHRETIWKCQCSCGNEQLVEVMGYKLRNGHTQSCGCLRKDTIKSIGFSNKTHGDTNTRLYKTYDSMKQRCLNPKCSLFKNYGGRGITICEEWVESYEEFKKWAVVSGYKNHLTIDRINVNGNYEPSNCRWSTSKEQSNNKRNNHYVTYKGETHTISEWADILEIPYTCFASRFKRTKDIEKIFETPYDKSKSRIKPNM